MFFVFLWPVVVGGVVLVVSKVVEWAYKAWIAFKEYRQLALAIACAVAFYAMLNAFIDTWIPEYLGVPDIPEEWKDDLQLGLHALNAWIPVAEMWLVAKLYLKLWFSAVGGRFTIRMLEHMRGRR